MRFRGLTCARGAELWLGVLALAIGTVGCVRVERAADRQVAAMQEAIDKMQQERDRRQQPLDLEADGAFAASEPSEPAQPRAKAPVGPAAPVRTVQIGHADDGLEDADPNAPGSRPEIRLHGSSRYGRTRSAVRAEPRIEPAENAHPVRMAPSSEQGGDGGGPLGPKETR